MIDVITESVDVLASTLATLWFFASDLGFECLPDRQAVPLADVSVRSGTLPLTGVRGAAPTGYQ